MDAQTNEPRYLSKLQAASYLGVCSRTVDAMVSRDGLITSRVGLQAYGEADHISAFLRRRRMSLFRSCNLGQPNDNTMLQWKGK